MDVNRLPIALSSAFAILLAVAAGPATALGLGQIQVKSQPGQPLLAEIPIISTDPSELQGLQVQLASPETFSRIGLEPPQGIVSTLHFEPALDTGGHPVIRITSPAAVRQPLLTFLIEVDWGQGRLVREYSALLDTPRTVAAPLQPPIQAPVVAPSNTIVRPDVMPVAVAPQPSAAPSIPTPQTTPAPPSLAIPPATPEPVSAAPPVAAAPIPLATPPRSQYGPVKAGDTLGQIAAAIDPSQEHSAAQTMLALLHANPEAFINGNVNLLKRGAILQVPDHSEFAQYSANEAAALVHAQIVQWRGAQRTTLQPAAGSASEKATSTTSTAVVAAPARNVPARILPTHTTVARTREARLDIMPASSSRGKRAGVTNQATQSGIQAGGEGDMLRQQLQETKETLAARDAEVNELKTRVADLEKLQQQQQQLLTLKNSALAAAQQTLATSNRKVEMPVSPQPTPAKPATTNPPAVVATQPVPSVQPAAQWGNAWLWGGLALVILAFAGWLVSRRRRVAVVATPRRAFDTAALAASIPSKAHGLDVNEDEVLAMETLRDAKTAPAGRVTSASGTVTPAPTWHAPDTHGQDPEPSSVIQTPLQRAQSMLDVGDDDSARSLLLQILDSRDPAARETAARMLRDL
jgi:pilus assembly protein FimV